MKSRLLVAFTPLNPVAPLMARASALLPFFRGCLMRCLYCHNRDTWDTHGGKEITVEDLMKEVVTYRHFMNASGGGVTASGGEAILQAEFVRDWFRACKRRYPHLSRHQRLCAPL